MEVVTLDHWEACNECGADLPPGSVARKYGNTYYCDAGPGQHPGPRPRPAGTDSDRRRRPAAAAESPVSPQAAELATAKETRELIIHLLEGIKFVIESAIDQLRK